MKIIRKSFHLAICMMLLPTTLFASIDGLSSIQDFLIAGRNGNVEIQFHLGRLYEKGEGVTRDIEESLHWYQLSAEQGYVYAQEILGDWYAGSYQYIPIPFNLHGILTINLILSAIPVYILEN